MIYNNKQVHHYYRDHEDRPQHIDYHVATIQPHIKQIEIINS
jgi:hypothetical protein